VTAIGIDDIRAAASRLERRILRSPLRRSDWLSEAAGAHVGLKLETLQPTFSYKIRGALNAVLALQERGERPPLVTASAGNHGRALAYAARLAGLTLTVYVPETAPRTKVDAIRALGAELRPCPDYDQAEARAKEHGASGAAHFISPYSHPDIIAGAGTVGLEILQQDPDVEAIVVPIGGGGLVSGIAIAGAAAAPHVDVIGVEVEASHPFTSSLAAGRIVEIEVGPTLADGLAGNMDPDTITFDIVRRLVRRIVLVGEPQLREAIAAVAREERLIVEGAAATGPAAVLSGQVGRNRKIAVVLSGANIDIEKIVGVLRGC
jgi:threonine dehydratase